MTKIPEDHRQIGFIPFEAIDAYLREHLSIKLKDDYYHNEPEIVVQLLLRDSVISEDSVTVPR